MILNIIDKITGNDLYFGVFIVILVVIIFLVVKSMIKGKKPVVKKEVVEKIEPKVEEKEEVINKEKEEAKLELEKVVQKMSEDENNRPIRETSYEEDQEDKAIISYQELLKATNGEKNQPTNEYEDIKASYNEDEVNGDDIIASLNKIEENKVEEDIPDIIVEENDDNTKFEQTLKSMKSDYVEPIIEEKEDKLPEVEEKLDESDIRSLLKEKSVLHTENTNIVEKPLEYGAYKKEHEFKNSEFISPVHGTQEYNGEYFKKHEDDDIEIIDTTSKEEKMEYKATDPTQDIDNDFFKEVNIDDEVDTQYLENKVPSRETKYEDAYTEEDENEEMLGQTLSFGRISGKIENNDDFLNSLKDLRKNL